MLILRLTQHAATEPDLHHIEVRLEGDGLAPYAAQASFAFALTPQDQEDLRWYLEDYLQYPLEPAPAIAARVERRMAEIGKLLFQAVFQASDDARDLWATLRGRLDETRVEIVTSVGEATAIPWELIRDAKTDIPLALRARSFVRAQPQAAQRPRLLAQTEEAKEVRILLVICRPGKDDDVPFRSVAGRIIKGLNEDARRLFRLDVLRPPTFEALGKALRAAKGREEPYHIVHFDGHGAFMDVGKLFEIWEEEATDEAMAQALRELGARIDPRRYSPQAIYPGTPRPGNRGYLVFENPISAQNLRLVDGAELGKLLVETHVPVLALNACRSAHAEAPSAPAQTGEGDVHAQVRAFGSLAQEVMDAGAAGVVAMRYNVYVVTAAQFVADLYAKLAQGYTLGESVTLGRKGLHDNPQREIAFAPRPLQDWPVPIVYEAAPIAFFPQPKGKAALTITLDTGGEAPAAKLDPNLPKRPDVGFIGRDETLLAMDRAFDTQSIVLLHAYAGSGKTTAAAEFARWYALTGGVDGSVLFTSFEQYKPLARVLDQLEGTFGSALEQAGVNWLALDDEERRAVALQVLRQIPVLWIWDNVEPVAGFPTGTASAWSVEEQEELADFLRDARETQAKFLLTTRRDEQAWLGELPARIAVPPMPMPERVLMARALAEKHGRCLAEVEDWRPLLQFTGGNPLTITVVVGQALRDGLKTKGEIEAYVGRLRGGEAAFEDEASEGRSRSLGASLSYGFAGAFSEDERKVLALLYFFQGFVNVE